MKQKFIVEDRYGNLVGLFKTLKEAKTYVEKDAADAKSGYETQNPQIHPEPYISEEWVDETTYVLDIYDNFEYQRHIFNWNIKVLTKPQFTF